MFVIDEVVVLCNSVTHHFYDRAIIGGLARIELIVRS